MTLERIREFCEARQWPEAEKMAKEDLKEGIYIDLDTPSWVRERLAFALNAQGKHQEALTVATDGLSAPGSLRVKNWLGDRWQEAWDRLYKPAPGKKV